MAYFPMFVDINDADCLIVGGGKVALRKVQVLLDFGANVFLVAKEISDDILEIAKDNKCLRIENRAFVFSDLDEKAVVVVATNDNDLNSEISIACKKRAIPVNVVDDKEKCSFIFPAYVKEQNIVGAVSSAGNSPVIAQVLKKKLSEIITKDMGDLNEKLGNMRQELILKYPDEAKRKETVLKMIENIL